MLSRQASPTFDESSIDVMSSPENKGAMLSAPDCGEMSDLTHFSLNMQENPEAYTMEKMRSPRKTMKKKRGLFLKLNVLMTTNLELLKWMPYLYYLNAIFSTQPWYLNSLYNSPLVKYNDIFIFT